MTDAPAIYARYASDPDVARYLPWRPHKDVEESQTFLSHLLNAIERGGTHAWIVESKEDRRLMGLMSMGIHSAREGDFLSTEEERRVLQRSALVITWPDPNGARDTRLKGHGHSWTGR